MKHRPAIMVEVSDQVLKSETDRGKVFDFFDEMRYQKYVLDQHIELIPPDENRLNDYTNFIFFPM